MNKLETDKLKKTELEILDHFVDFCQKNNLTYYLTYGSLLGAVRHKGFIPWDDDIDIAMPPEDYQKFLSLYKKEKQDKYLLQYINNEKYYHTIFAKIRKNNTCMVEKEWQYIKIHKGINIDIFPLFPYPDSKRDAKKLMFNLKLAQLLTSKNNKTKSIKNKIIFFLLRLIPRKITNKIVSNILNKSLNYNKPYYYYKTDELNSPALKIDWYKEKIELPFENRKYTAPKDYDEVLKSMYGDYMTPPKEEDRVGHGDIILSFNKNYEELQGVNNENKKNSLNFYN